MYNRDLATSKSIGSLGHYLGYKDRIDLATAQGLDEMVAISQELGLYD